MAISIIVMGEEEKSMIGNLKLKSKNSKRVPKVQEVQKV
jgi:hypothetical protein